MILLSDPRLQQLPIHESGEPLVDTSSALLLDSRERDSAGTYSHVRSNVLDRLRFADRTLPKGTQLLIIEGHRTTSEQARRFNLYQQRIHASGITDRAELHIRTSAFVSPVDVAPHCTGGAVDLSLADAAGAELDMGGPVNGHRTGDERSCPLEAPGLSALAQRNRQLLVKAMNSAGFVNYPTEWWHWSFGDRYWALLTGARAAVYGPV
ncbi:M15 family metallopeptidase [Streptomyces sp. LaBMicrA B280]|uniref:M15 family metallopeptidase n=1 Tax=Streptomyces sp. LaBMicrA B280 TaxID=3391001 RepID=UPI003BA4B09F